MSAEPRLIRTMLFVPGSRPNMMEKAARAAADAVCFDLEDSVVPEEKGAARHHIIHALKSIDFGHRVKMVRVNALDTEFTYRDVVEVMEAVGDRIDVVMLPKADTASDVQFLDTLLTQIETHKRFSSRVGIEVQIESAKGFLNVREIAASTPRLEAITYGPGDFAASMQIPMAAIGERDSWDDIYPGHRWHDVMHTIVAAARAHGLRCMDGPFAGIADTAGLDRAAHVARAMGFDGKQCIHPGQLPVVNAVFTPTDDEAAKAEALLAAYQVAATAGQGAAKHEGKMIDAVNLRMARRVLERRRLAQLAQ